MEPLTPDFRPHGWRPLSSAVLVDGFVELAWPDGCRFDAYSLWLAENAPGYGLEPSSRESMLEPNRLPSPNDLLAADLDVAGALVLSWVGGRTTTVHPGWLRSIAEGEHLAGGGLPERQSWTTVDFDEPPTIDGSSIRDDPAVMHRWLHTLVRYGLCRLEATPSTPDFVGELLGSVGPIRDTNFGPVWPFLDGSSGFRSGLPPTRRQRISTGTPRRSDAF